MESEPYTKLPNFIIDALPEMSESEIKIVLVIARLTFGWQRESAEISTTEFMRQSGLSKQSALNGINAALDRQTIEREKSGKTYIYRFVIGLNFRPMETTVQNLDQSSVKNLDQMSLDFRPIEVQNLDRSTPALKKDKEKTTKKGKENARAAPPRRIARVDSPYIKAIDFTDGFIPSGKGKNAVQVYYERFDIRENAARLNAIKEDDLVRHCKDLDRLRRVVTEYSRTPYRPGNVGMIIDWYRRGTPDEGRQSASMNGNRPMSKIDATMAAIDRVEQRMRNEGLL